jgi:hypothetical protein
MSVGGDPQRRSEHAFEEQQQPKNGAGSKVNRCGVAINEGAGQNRCIGDLFRHRTIPGSQMKLRIA